MEPGAAELYDQALLGILQHVGNVQDFLRVLFGFLYRKTDFYRLLRHPSDRMGFPPGAAQALVLQVRWGAVGRWDLAVPYPSSTQCQACPRVASYARGTSATPHPNPSDFAVLPGVPKVILCRWTVVREVLLWEKPGFVQDVLRCWKLRP